MSKDRRGCTAGAQGLRWLGLIAAICAAFSAPALAQEERIFIEEIIVYAQKREQSLLEVPVAVSTLSGIQIQEAGIKDVWDLQQNVPALRVGRSQTSTTSNFSIRSIGSTSNNFGVESSVGLYIDGVYRSRQSSLIQDLIDMEAVEVLRGPQGTLFGKNTAAGAIALRTVRPSQDRDAFVDFTVGDRGLVKVSAATNIPLNDNWAFRGTVFSTQRDGTVDDANLGDDLYNDRDRLGTRLQLAYNEPEDDFNVRIIADYSEIDETCCIGMPRIDSLVYQGALPQVLANPNAVQTGCLLADGRGTSCVGSDFLNAALGGTVFATYNYPQPLIDGFNANPQLLGSVIGGAQWDDYVTALNRAPISQNEDMGLSIEFNKRLGDSVTLRSITAYRSFETLDDIDADFSDVDIVGRINTAEQSSISQEFQFTGEFGTGSTWVAGLYYFGQDLDSTTRTSTGLLTNTFVKQGTPAIQGVIDGVNGLDAALDDPALAPLLTAIGLDFLPGLVNPATEPFPAGASAFDIVEQDHQGYAVFGQVDFSISDSFVLTLGARFTDETKDINAVYEQTASPNQFPDTAACTFDPTNPFGPLGDYSGGQICTGLTEANIFFTPALPDGLGGFVPNPCFLGGDPQVLMGAEIFCADLDAILAGALDPVSEPNQAWGFYQFDPFRPRSNVKDTLEDDQVTGTFKLSWFPSESTMLYASYATGFKAGGTNTDRINEAFPQIFQAETSESIEIGLKGQYGPVQIFATVYQTEFEDFQENAFFGGGFNLQNAGDIEIEGFELEFLWRPTDHTEIQAWFARNEGEYLSFELGTGWDTWVRHVGIWQNPVSGDPGCLKRDPVPDPLSFPEQCPRDGEKLPYNPENRGFVAITQELELGRNTTAFARLEYSYGSGTTTDGDNDPFTYLDDYEIVNARLGFNFDNINSTLTFWGRNLTDERYQHGSFDVPLSEDKMLSYPSEPRTWGVTFRKNFD